jgi:hypothetical protein
MQPTILLIHNSASVILNRMFQIWCLKIFVPLLLSMWLLSSLLHVGQISYSSFIVPSVSKFLYSTILLFSWFQLYIFLYIIITSSCFLNCYKMLVSFSPSHHSVHIAPLYINTSFSYFYPVFIVPSIIQNIWCSSFPIPV